MPFSAQNITKTFSVEIQRFIKIVLIRLHREMLPFLYGLHRFQINTRFIQCHKNSAGSRSCNQQFVAYANLGSFNQKLGDSDVRKVFDPFSHVNLTFRCRRSIIAGPFSQTLSEIVAVPVKLPASWPRTFLLE